MHYEGVQRNVTLDDGRKFKAFFPKKHSKVEAIVYQYLRYDNNRGDAWANMHDWQERVTIYVLWKHLRSWEKVADFEGRDRPNISYFPINSLDDLLFNMEEQSVRKIYNLLGEQDEVVENIKKEKNRLSQIKKEIKSMEKYFQSIKKENLKV